MGQMEADARSKAEGLDDFVACYHGANRHQRTATWSESNPEGRWRCYTYEEIAARDKASLDITWLRDLSLEDSATLQEPDMLAAEIMEDWRLRWQSLGGLRESCGFKFSCCVIYYIPDTR